MTRKPFTVGRHRKVNVMTEPELAALEALEKIASDEMGACDEWDTDVARKALTH